MARAQRVIAATAQAKGGAPAAGRKIIGQPVMLRAERLLAAARR